MDGWYGAVRGQYDALRRQREMYIRDSDKGESREKPSKCCVWTAFRDSPPYQVQATRLRSAQLSRGVGKVRV